MVVSSRQLPVTAPKVETAPTYEPSYKMLLEPPTGIPEYIIVEVSLPAVVRFLFCSYLWLFGIMSAVLICLCISV